MARTIYVQSRDIYAVKIRPSSYSSSDYLSPSPFVGAASVGRTVEFPCSARFVCSRFSGKHSAFGSHNEHL